MTKLLNKNIIILLLTLCTLSGCGFHLRQTPLHLEKKYPTIVLPPLGSNTFHQALRAALLACDIRVLENPLGSQYPQLRVVGQQLPLSPLVYGPDAELRRERMRMTVTFSFGIDKPQEFSISAIRDRQLNSKQHLGDNAEKILIEEEMQKDIINQLLRYLASNT